MSLTSEPAFLEELSKICSIEEEPFQKLLLHLKMVLEANKQINLTSITDYREALFLHIYDSLLGLPMLDKANKGTYADIGTGAGYPGIPLALCSNRDTELIEATKKKANLLNEFVNRLEIQNKTKVIPLRAETLAKSSQEIYSAVSFRSVSTIPSLLELAQPLLKPDGIAIIYKGPNGYEEVKTSIESSKKLGMQLNNIESFLIPLVSQHRLIITYQKTDESEIPLPRAEGKAQTNPIK